MGFMEGLGNVAEGMMQGQDKAMDRQAKQQELTMRANQLNTQQQNAQTQKELMDLQLQQTQMKIAEDVRQIGLRKTKEDLYRSFDSGSMLDFNSLLKSDKNIQKRFPGVDSIEKIDLTNPEQVRQAEGMVEPVLTNVIKDGRLVKQVRDLNKLKIESGYSTHKYKREAESGQMEKSANYQVDMNNAIATGDMAKIQEVHNKYNPQTPKAPTAADKLSAFKLEKEMKTQEVMDYVNNNVTGFRDEIRKGGLDSKISGHSLYGIAKQVQGDNKLDVGRKTFLEGMTSTIKNTNRLRTKMATSDFNWDALSKGMDEVTKITGAEWRDLDEKERKAMLERFSFDSDLKTVMAGYIKAMSGAAVSDQERGFYEHTILGGNWATKEAAVASMDGFISGLKGGMGSAMEGMIGDMPASYLNYKDRLDKIKIDTSEIPVAPAPEKKPSMTETVSGNIKSLWNKYTTPTTKDVSEY